VDVETFNFKMLNDLEARKTISG